MDARPTSHGAAVARIGPVQVLISPERVESVVRSTQVEAIVTSDDANLEMAGGVAAAIGEPAGVSVAKGLGRLPPLAVGQVGITPGGHLPVKYIFHAVTVDWRKNILPTERTIQQLAREILVRCETLPIRCIAVTAFGTGGPLSLDSAKVSSGWVRAKWPAGPAWTCRRAFSRRRTARAAETAATVPLPADARSSSIRRRPAAAQLLTGEEDSRPLIDARYVLLEEIGRGGVAIVYLAWDAVLRRTVAIKVLRRDVPYFAEGVESLRREATLAMDLTHEGIVRIFEPDSRSAGPYLVMEYLPWPTGEKWIADSGDRGLPVHSVLEIGVQLARALAYAHEREVLHTDIKPGNVFVDPAAEHAKISDFGLARALSARSRKALQLSPAGTPAYMTPEQLMPGAKVGPPTDITSWPRPCGTS